jgi:hypothetical protein
MFPPRSVSAGTALLCGLLLLGFFVTGRLDAVEYRPGKTYFGRNQYVEYIAGDLPIVIAAPHGGREKPEELPDREKGTFAFDTNTQELARAVAEVLHERTGHYAHVIICRVHRRKVDCNREVVEAAAGNERAVQVWTEFQGFIDDARSAVVARAGKGFFIDLHGHGHKDQRLEIGYLHTRATLALPDAQIDQPKVIAEGSLRLFASRSKIPYSELLRGPLSFGAMLEREGFPSTPSPLKPVPSDPYFAGGHNTQCHARYAANFAGLQIETNFKGVRDTAENRAKFGEALCNALGVYLDTHMSLKLPRVSGNPAKAAQGSAAIR